MISNHLSTRNRKQATLNPKLETSNSKPETNEHRQNRICVSAADFAAHERAGCFVDGAGAADEGVAAVYHKSAA